MKTLDEAIKYCNEEAEAWKKDAERLNKHGLTEATQKYVDECAKVAEFNEQLANWLTELKAYKEKENRDCSSCARYSEFQKEVPEECKGCKHNYFSNYKEKEQ